MDYNKARTFVEVVDSGGITQAAKRVLRSQQAISLQIQALEEDLGIMLFDRHGPNIILTKEGELLYEQFRANYALMERAVYELQASRTMASGTIKLGVWLEQGASYLPRIITKFLQQFPRVRFDVTVDTDEGLEARLLRNEIDFGFFLAVQDKKLIATTPVVRRNLVLTTSSSHLTQKKTKVRTFADTLKLDLIDYAEPLSAYKSWI